MVVKDRQRSSKSCLNRFDPRYCCRSISGNGCQRLFRRNPTRLLLSGAPGGRHAVRVDRSDGDESRSVRPALEGRNAVRVLRPFVLVCRRVLRFEPSRQLRPARRFKRQKDLELVRFLRSLVPVEITVVS